jgi:hypothetical protein
LDLVISPGIGCQALPHGKTKDAGLAALYTSLWNILDTTTGSIPITIVR